MHANTSRAKSNTNVFSSNITWNAFHCMRMMMRPHLDVSAGVYLVNCISRCTSSLSIQVIALNKHGVIAQTAHPHVSLTFALQLYTFTNVEPEVTDTGEGRKSREVGCYTHSSWLETHFTRLLDQTTHSEGGVPGSFYVLCPVNIAQLAQAKAIPS